MNIIDNNISYFIPLEEIDINYCYGKEKKLDEPMSLWTPNSSNYCELKIYVERKGPKSQNEENVTAGDSFVKIPKYKCHVCNISVPTVYKKDHINSPKHKICLKIIDTAITRVKHGLFQSEEDKQQLKSTQHSYYCESCSVEVKLINRKDHDMSKEHFKSKMHDKLLDDLLKIYIDKEHLEKVDLEYMTNHSLQNGNDKQYDSDPDVSDEDVNQNEAIDTFLNLMQNLNDDKSVHSSNDSEVDTTRPSSVADDDYVAHEISNKEFISIETHTDNTNLKEYIDMLLSNEKGQLQQKFSVIGDRVIIEASDKSVLTVSEDNFHSFIRDNDGKVYYCKLCALSVKDEKSHILMPEHMRNVMTPIQDLHGIRQFQGRNGTALHCVLCNYNLVVKENHIASKTHINSLKPSMGAVTSEINTNNAAQPATTTQSNSAKVETETTYCQPCDRHIHTNNFHSHTNGATHKYIAKAKINVHSEKTNNNNVIVPFKTYCAPCDRYVGTKHFNAHLSSQRHKNYVELRNGGPSQQSLQPKPSTSKGAPDNAMKYCDVCEKYVSTIQFPSHVEGKPHQNNIILKKKAVYLELFHSLTALEQDGWIF